jgi:hypothetical protein
MRIHAENSLDSNARSIIAGSLIRATRLELFFIGNTRLCDADLQLAGLPVPPSKFVGEWMDVIDAYRSSPDRNLLPLVYARRFEAFCRIVCTNRSHMASSMRLAAPVLQLRIHATAASAVVWHLTELTCSQQLLLLSTASCACHLARVLLMPGKVSYGFNKLLLQRMFDEVMVRRLVLLSWE